LGAWYSWFADGVHFGSAERVLGNLRTDDQPLLSPHFGLQDNKRSFAWSVAAYASGQAPRTRRHPQALFHKRQQAKEFTMSKERDNKAIVGRWFTGFWGNPWNPDIVNELAAPDMLLQYSLHAPRRGHADVKAFMLGFREAFPDLSFAGAADLIAEGDYVVGRWQGGGTHTGPAFSDFLIGGSLPASSGRKMQFTGMTVLRVENGKIAEEIGLDDGVTALQQLGLIRAA
jgi:predicted ester cyclase